MAEAKRVPEPRGKEGLLAPALIHELRQPLMAIRVGLELIARQQGASLVCREEWKIVKAQVDHLAELLRCYQTLLGGAAPEIEPFDPAPVIDRAIALVGPRLRELGSCFCWRGCGERLLCRGQPAALLHTLTNLLVNALDAVEETGRSGRIEVRALPGLAALELRVSDEGRGVPPEDREQIFQPHFTTKPRDRGSGLGLHIAREAMMRSGGSVELVADRDPSRLAWAQTEFRVTLPLAER